MEYANPERPEGETRDMYRHIAALKLRRTEIHFAHMTQFTKNWKLRWLNMKYQMTLFTADLQHEKKNEMTHNHEN